MNMCQSASLSGLYATHSFWFQSAGVWFHFIYPIFTLGPIPRVIAFNSSFNYQHTTYLDFWMDV